MSKEELMLSNANGSRYEHKMMLAVVHKWMIRGIALLILLVIAGVAVIVGPRVLAEYRASIVAQKKADIDMVTQSVRTHIINTQNVPQNVINGWCVVGQGYPSGQCLGELSNANLPVSPDEDPYYYYAAKNYIIIATKLTPAEDGPGQNVGACAPGYGDTYWCTELDRKQFAQNTSTELSLEK